MLHKLQIFSYDLKTVRTAHGMHNREVTLMQMCEEREEYFKNNLL